MSYFEFFKDAMLKKYNEEAASDRDFILYFEIEDEDICVGVFVEMGELTIKLVDIDDDDFDLKIISEKKFITDIVSDSEVTGVDTYFDGDLELEGNRAMLEDLFEVFGIV